MTVVDFAGCVAKGCFAEADLAALTAYTATHGAAEPLDAEAMADYLREAEGANVPCICARLRQDITLALRRTDHAHAARLLATLDRYLQSHPRTCP